MLWHCLVRWLGRMAIRTTSIALAVFLSTGLHLSAEGQSVIAQEQPMTFRLSGTGGNCNGCEGIDDQTVERFTAFLGDDDFCGFVQLHSPGGSLLEGMELGREFRRRRCATSVGRTTSVDGTPWENNEPGFCASSCALALMGGKERYVGPNELGVHQFYLAEEAIQHQGDPGVEYGIAKGQFYQALIISYLIETGIDPNLISAMVSAGPSEVHWLTADELARWNVDNMRERRKPWWIEAYKGGAVAVMQSTYGEQPTDTLTLFCRAEEGGQAYLMLSREWDESWRSVPLSSVSIEFSGGQASTWSDVQVDQGAGSPTIRFGKTGPSFLAVPISHTQSDALLSGESFTLDVSLPHVCGFGWGLHAQFDDASLPAAALVLRNCI